MYCVFIKQKTQVIIINDKSKTAEVSATYKETLLLCKKEKRVEYADSLFLPNDKLH